MIVDALISRIMKVMDIVIFSVHSSVESSYLLKTDVDTDQAKYIDNIGNCRVIRSLTLLRHRISSKQLK